MRLPLFSAALLFLPLSAQAALGGTPEYSDSSSSSVPQTSARSTSAFANTTRTYNVHQSVMPSGTVVREYVRGDGTVFAVTWEGPTMPELQRLFGPTYFAQYRQVLPAQRAGRGHFSVKRENLVAHSVGHLRAFSGAAYVPQLLPQGVSVDELQ